MSIYLNDSDLRWIYTNDVKDAIKFIKKLKICGVKVYWNNDIKRLVINPRKRLPCFKIGDPKRRIGGFGPSIARRLTEVLSIKSKDDWMGIKKIYDI